MDNGEEIIGGEIVECFVKCVEHRGISVPTDGLMITTGVHDDDGFVVFFKEHDKDGRMCDDESVTFFQ